MLIFKQPKFFASRLIIQEFQTKYNILKPGLKVLELGCGKYEWTEYMIKKVESTNEQIKVFAVDEVPNTDLEGSTFINGNIQEQKTLMKIQEALDLNPVDIIVSQIDFPSEEDPDQDNLKMIPINRTVLKIASKTLKQGGAILMKACNGLPEVLNKVIYFIIINFIKTQRFIKLLFQQFYEIKPTAGNLQPFRHYYLGVGFKQSPEYKIYESFIQKMLNQQEHLIKEEEIPPSYQTKAERDLEVFKFLQYISDNQLAVTKEYIDQAKDKYPDLKWDKYTFNIVQKLTEEQEFNILEAQYGGQLSFTKRRNLTIEQLQQEYDTFVKQMQPDQAMENALLEEDEVLGSAQYRSKEDKIMQDSMKPDITKLDDLEVTDEEMKKFEKFSTEMGGKYIKDQYADKKSGKEILQAELDKGTITREDLEEFYNLKNEKLNEKIEEDFQFYANRKSDKEISRMTKEHRTPYYEQKKKIKTRRQ